jgi:hypothetical protein
MKYLHLSTVGATLAMALAALSAGHTFAADPDTPKTRAEVIKELEEAKKMGDIPSNAESGMQLNELYPNRYPPQDNGPRLTREQVRQELERARKAGEIPMPVTE